MTDPERTEVAEKLLALIFSLRPDNSPTSQAWVLGVTTTAMARAIVASTATGLSDCGDLLTVAHQQLVTQVRSLETAVIRERLTRGVPGGSGPRRVS